MFNLGPNEPYYYITTPRELAAMEAKLGMRPLRLGVKIPRRIVETKNSGGNVATDMDNWYLLTIDFRERVVNFLQKELPPQFFHGMKAAYEKNNSEWWAEGGWHFSQGMAIRNMLREGGFEDNELPTENWDDYYIQALEVAAGLHGVAA